MASTTPVGPIVIKPIVTKLFIDPAKGSGRAVVVTAKNGEQITGWLEAQLITCEFTKTGPKIKLTTPKGARVAVVGDTIVKYGTRANGKVPTFEVVKAK